eukprot:GILK01012579.1.p1 GENE.GILK01012579.1~~GILK01012579.1.p1  ORF type:complete len:553 (+),score=86.87 GILK01012579.1:19-1677(+)
MMHDLEMESSALETTESVLPPSIDVRIVGFELIADNATAYRIQLTADETTRIVVHRYRDFFELHSTLQLLFTNLPYFPPKTMQIILEQSELRQYRQERLETYLQGLLDRLDTASHPLVLEFLELTTHFPSYKLPTAAPSLVDPKVFEGRIGITAVEYLPDEELLFCALQDYSSFARMGRLWSIVEPDELGALLCFKKNNPTAGSKTDSTSADSTTASSNNDSKSKSRSLFQETFAQVFPIKVCSFAWDSHRKQAFVGFEDGVVTVYTVSQDRPAFVLSDKMVLHKAAVYGLHYNNGFILSCGADNHMCLIDANERKVINGGSLAKRLGSNHLTCCIFHASTKRAFLGSSGRDIYVYSLESTPPQLLTTVTGQAGPISCMDFDGRHLIFGDGTVAAVWLIEGKGRERRSRQAALFRSLTEGDLVRSVRYSSHLRHVVAGYESGSVVTWAPVSGSFSAAIKAHDAAVTVIRFYDSGRTLFTGGADGLLKMFSFNEQYVSQASQLASEWNQRRIDQSANSSSNENSVNWFQDPSFQHPKDPRRSLATDLTGFDAF